jgi:hypothetical protein
MLEEVMKSILLDLVNKLAIIVAHTFIQSKFGVDHIAAICTTTVGVQSIGCLDKQYTPAITRCAEAADCLRTKGEVG